MTNRQRGRRSGESTPDGGGDGVEPARAKTRVFFRIGTGRSPAQKAFSDLPKSAQAGLDLRWKRYRDGELRGKDLKPVTGSIYELRYRELNNQYRLIFLAWGHVAVVLDAFYKNQESLTKQELDRFKDRAAIWVAEHGKHPPNDWA